MLILLKSLNQVTSWVCENLNDSVFLIFGQVFIGIDLNSKEELSQWVSISQYFIFVTEDEILLSIKTIWKGTKSILDILYFSGPIARISWQEWESIFKSLITASIHYINDFLFTDFLISDQFVLTHDISHEHDQSS